MVPRNANADWLSGLWYDRHKHVIWISPIAYFPPLDPDAAETLDHQFEAATLEIQAGVGAVPRWFERAKTVCEQAKEAEKANVAARVAAAAASVAADAARLITEAVAPPIPPAQQ